MTLHDALNLLLLIVLVINTGATLYLDYLRSRIRS